MQRLFLTAVLTIGLIGSVQAAGDATAGQAKAAACAACHGADGNSAAPNFPKLAGQGERYLLKQMHEIKSGARAAPLMAGQLDNL
ncbi:MAG TPA: c-type cytochrome, partial [Pseudomonadales bacterium]|nr:c-type cytochrome [Pseudomonadales bacterium]